MEILGHLEAMVHLSLLLLLSLDPQVAHHDVHLSEELLGFGSLLISLFVLESLASVHRELVAHQVFNRFDIEGLDVLLSEVYDLKRELGHGLLLLSAESTELHAVGQCESEGIREHGIVEVEDSLVVLHEELRQVLKKGGASKVCRILFLSEEFVLDDGVFLLCVAGNLRGLKGLEASLKHILDVEMR